MAVIRIHIATICVGQFELHPGKRLLRDGVQFPDDEGAFGLVVEPERLHLAGFDFNGLGCAI